MTAGTLLLAVVALGLIVLLVQAVRQNLALFRQVRAGERPVTRLLGEALVLWSPLALVILAVALAAHWCTDAAVALVYRATPVDEFCVVEGVAGRGVVPCTGMDGRLPRDAVRRADAQAELEHHLSARFREARLRTMRLSAEELRVA
ncbi:MAG: hypothetical protein ACREO3_03940, partial [Arenimonas sp.]